MRTDPRRVIAMVGCAVALAINSAPPPAATTAGTVRVTGGQLTFTAGAGADNNVVITPLANGLVDFRDVGADLIAGDGCDQISASQANCHGVTSILADGRDGNDSIGVRETVFAPVAPTPATLRGGSGDDQLRGGSGADVLDGGPGADTLVGGTGVDTVTYAGRTAPVVADPDGTRFDDGEAKERDTIELDVENLVGGSAADHLSGNDAANRLLGSAGGDYLYGLGGTDRLEGQSGFDHLDGGYDSDVCVPGPDGASTNSCEIVL
ncbi:calcium-binding protein [Longispora sp. NPDC051575]|uniref:calcium-binding protein n=1 Tax=Longispora sp. NPDC051575 TaxID=3154943 RepID=UPI00344AAE1B